MEFHRPILSFKHATCFLKALNASGQLYRLGLGPKPSTEPAETDLTAQQEYQLSQRASELERINWKPNGFPSWIAYVGSLPCTATLKNIQSQPLKK